MRLYMDVIINYINNFITSCLEKSICDTRKSPVLLSCWTSYFIEYILGSIINARVITTDS